MRVCIIYVRIYTRRVVAYTFYKWDLAEKQWCPTGDSRQGCGGRNFCFLFFSPAVLFYTDALVYITSYLYTYTYKRHFCFNENRISAEVFVRFNGCTYPYNATSRMHYIAHNGIVLWRVCAHTRALIRRRTLTFSNAATPRAIAFSRDNVYWSFVANLIEIFSSTAELSGRVYNVENRQTVVC